MQKLTHFKVHHLGSSLKSAWATQEGEPLTNFRVCTRGARLHWNFRDGSTGRFRLFLLCFHIAGLVLVSTISISLHQPNLTPPVWPLLSYENSRDQHCFSAAVSARSCRHLDQTPAQPTRTLCSSHGQAGLGPT